MRGPVAPKDPVDKRPCLYVILDKVIAGRKERDGKFRDHIFMEGRLQGQVQFTSGDVDPSILALLSDVKGFRTLVHSIGVSMQASDQEDREKEATFVVQCYGKTDKYSTGTNLEMTVPCTGEEMVLCLDAYPENEEDTVIGAFHVTLPEENKNVALTVKFYLQDGYEVPEIEVDPPVQFGTEEYEEMISRSMLQTGNTYRLKRVIERAKAGEDVTIAFIGGSITQGAGAKPIHTQSYAYRTYEAFCRLFSPCEGKNVHYVKAGLGGTPSELGMIRYEEDVTSNGEITPDLVVVEFAVNDAGDETNGVCFESLVKKILQAENEPAVLLNFAVFMNDFNLQERLIPIGERYRLPMVSVKNAVTPQFEQSNIITKRQFFYDIFHPTNDGHRIMADCITYLLQQVDQGEADSNDLSLDVPPVYGTQFADVTLVDRSNVQQYALVEQVGFDAMDREVQYTERNLDLDGTPTFTNNWMHDGSVKDAYFKLNVTCKNLLIVMKDSGDSSFGKVDVSVDGTYKKTLDPLLVGWTHSNALILLDESSVGNHEVMIRMHEGDEHKKFTIQGFGVTFS